MNWRVIHTHSYAKCVHLSTFITYLSYDTVTSLILFTFTLLSWSTCIFPILGPYHTLPGLVRKSQVSVGSRDRKNTCISQKWVKGKQNKAGNSMLALRCIFIYVRSELKRTGEIMYKQNLVHTGIYGTCDVPRKSYLPM